MSAAGGVLSRRIFSAHRNALSSARAIGTSVFIKGLPEVSEDELRLNLEQFGSVNNMDLFKTGFVYHCQVQFGDTNSAIAAVDCLDDSVFKGRRISAEFSHKLNRKSNNRHTSGNQSRDK